MDMIYTYILNEISVKKICIRMIAMFFYIFSKNVWIKLVLVDVWNDRSMVVDNHDINQHANGIE